jgi:hypothetical protein
MPNTVHTSEVGIKSEYKALLFFVGIDYATWTVDVNVLNMEANLFP